MATLFQSVPDLYFTPPNSDFIDDVAGNQQMFDTFTLGSESLVTSITFDVDNQAILFPNWLSEPLTVAIYTIGPGGGPGTEVFSATFTPADYDHINFNLSFATALVTYDTDLVLNAGTYLITYYNQDGLGAMGFASGGSGQAFAENLSTKTISPVDESLGFNLSGEVIPLGQTYIAGTPGEPLVFGNGSVFLDGSLLEGQTITAGNGNDTALAGSNDTITLGNGTDVVSAGDSDTISLGNGADTVTAGANSIITVGNGNDNVIAGSDSTITLGKGSDTVTIGDSSTVSMGNGQDTVTAGANAMIIGGNGNDTVTAGSESTIELGNGNDTVTPGSSSTVTLGNGNNTVFGGTNDTITVGKGNDQLVAAPGDVWTVGNGQDTFTFNAGFGNNTITDFNTSHDVLNFNPALLMNYAAAMADTQQVGANTVITVDATDTVTLTGVAASHLTASNFHFT